MLCGKCDDYIFRSEHGAGYVLSIFSCLGRLSMPLYVWHIAVLRVIERFFPDVDMLTKVLGFWLGTFALAIGNMYLVGFVKHRLRKDKECTMN